jgi:glycosyltransferase involved in cell wall biosynthesis
MEPTMPDVSPRVKGYVLKHPSPGSKGLLCLRMERNAEPYSREMMIELKRYWHFFWFSVWNTPHHKIAYHDLIDIFLTWDEHAAEIHATGRTNAIIVRGGSETYERHDLLFHPLPGIERDIDLLYVARFTPYKRADMALSCVNFVARHNPSCRAVFLESFASDPAMRSSLRQQRKALGLEANLQFTTVPLDHVNVYMNRARLCLFTSDEEGLCRATLQTLLAERPLLAYRNTRALTRHLYDDRFFHFYDRQTEESIGQAAWDYLSQPESSNPGARDYLLKERKFVFHDLADWQEQILAAAAPLYTRDGQTLDRRDVVPIDDGTRLTLWRNFRLEGHADLPSHYEPLRPSWTE